MKRMISLVVPLLGGAALLMAGAAPASADVDHYKINGSKTIQSQNNNVNFSAKSGRCNYQAKFIIQTGGPLMCPSGTWAGAITSTRVS
ncbi:hypothetical protein ACIBIZ_13300 [Nonomuraea spiralis]|uniref:hypothetical protein n=1 Tax=Nonomuraea spiralis TaxID=46182 RepID=UPI0037B8400B